MTVFVVRSGCLPPDVTPAQAGAHDDGRLDAYQRSDEAVPPSGIASVEARRGCRRFIVCDLRRGRRDDVPGEAHNFPSPHSCTSMGRGCPEGAGEGRPLVRNALPLLTPGLLLFARSDSPAASRPERAGIASAANAPVRGETRVRRPAPGQRAWGWRGGHAHPRERVAGRNKKRKNLSPPLSYLAQPTRVPRAGRLRRSIEGPAPQFSQKKLIPAPCCLPDTRAHLAVTARAQARWAFRER